LPRSLFFGIWAALHLACGAAGERENVVARVDDLEITAEELLRFKAETPALFRSEKTGVEELDEYLGSMIDMNLMYLDARSRGLDQTPEYLERWEEERKRKLVAVFLQQRLQEKLDVSPEELQQRFKESKWSRMLKLAHIRVDTEEEGRQVAAELAQGRAFEELARERSVYQQTASQGGLLEPYFGRGNIDELGMPLELAEQVFELKVGEYGGPFPLLGGYEVFKVVDERPAPPGYGVVFAQVTLQAAIVEQRQKVWAELRERYQVQPDQEGLRAFLAQAAAARGDTLRLDEGGKELVLCRFKGGQLKAGELVAALRRSASLRRISFDSSGVAGFIEDHLLPEILIYRSALEEGLEQDSTVASWTRSRRKALLIEALKAQEVERRVDLGEAALRQYYQDHQERFTLPAEIQMAEILCGNEVEAGEMRRRIQRGEDLQLLAAKHSRRPGAAKARGVFHLHPFERHRYPELYDAAEKAEPGSLQGPVKTAEGHSVFRVLAKYPPRPQPFEQALDRVKYWLRQEEEKRLIEALLARLREQYRPAIVLYNDRLSKMIDAETGT
jgi:parvulin-like peptidyl-prolyl isomerase